MLALESLKYPLLGGLYLGAASTALLNDFGRPFGCSGALHSFLAFTADATKAGLVVGLVATGVAVRAFLPTLEATLRRKLVDGGISSATGVGELALVVGGGFLAGIGTKIGSGCTSGHMLCGFSRGSVRSVAATMTFFPVALLTRWLVRSYLPLASVTSPPVLLTLPHTSSNAFVTATFLATPLALYAVLRRPSPSSPVLSRLLNFLRGLCLGSTFALGLFLSGMSRPSVVLGFLDLGLPSFDPSLLGVAVAGLGVNAVGFWAWIRPQVLRWKAAKEAAEANGEKGEGDSAEEVVGAEGPLLTRKEGGGAGWQLPELTNSTVDRRLIGGNVLFGLGWG